jgi:membrane-associated protease RseP (regulator of RpoE activity)
MSYALGVVLFALGILLSVCLHEAGHMYTAKAFGMKVTRYFVGFGPTLWSFRRGETEYGLKAIPAGGFVKIVGMTPQDEDVDPGEEHRAFWRHKVWKKTIVLSAGSATHFIVGFVLLWIAASFVGVPNQTDVRSVHPVIGVVYDCVTPAKAPAVPVTGCDKGQVKSPAASIGIQRGDQILSVNGVATETYGEVQQAIRSAPTDEPVIVEVRRAGALTTLRPSLVRGKVSDGSADSMPILGISPVLPPATVTHGPVKGLRVSADYTGQLFTGTFTALKAFPSKVPKLFAALSGDERDPATPISVVGASRIGGEAISEGGPNGPTIFLLVLASLNVFIGIFNMFPLLPLDGGHVAIAWFERVRSWLAVKRGRPDPGSVDYAKLMPITYAVVIIFGAISVLTIVTDIVNPLRLFQ